MIDIALVTPDDLPWIAALELRHYGSARAVAPPRLAEWYARNPLGFLVIREDDVRRGHVTVLPLVPLMLRALANGAKSENDIRAADIVAPADRTSVRGLYIESVIAEPLELLGELVRTFNRHVMRLAQPELLEAVYVCPSTPAGGLLAANLGFQRAGGSAVWVANYAELVRWTTLLRSRLGARRRSA